MLISYIMHKEHNHVCRLIASFPQTMNKHPSDINIQYLNSVLVHPLLKKIQIQHSLSPSFNLMQRMSNLNLLVIYET